MPSSRPELPTSTRILSITATLALALSLDGCVSSRTTPVPGSDKVHVTTNPSDVAGCTAVGNIKVPDMTADMDIQFRNQAVGFGGNAALVTVTHLGPVEGVAYRCPQ
jgi:hypothetical protein